MSNKKKSLWPRILSSVIVFLVLVNIALAAKTGTLYVEFWRLNEKEQSHLKSVFPPLSEEEVRNRLRNFYPELTSYESQTQGSLICYNIYKSSTFIGTAYQMREDIYCPVCLDVRAFVEVRDGKIGKIDLINPFHLYGKPMPIELQEKFLFQFEQKKIKARMQIGFNVDGISGATKSVEKFINGLYKIKLDMARD